ncbi:MAG: oleate hydratase [Candidatus Gracilibacteria bacterium]|nr:oleate hydratase [Candidatus Gracilibacteria bacterium]
MNNKSKYHIIGGGIAGLATAVYLIQEGKIKGEQISIYEKAKKIGGSLDAKDSNKVKGYTMRGIRAFEKSTYTAYMDLLGRIPTNNNKTLKDIFLDYNKEKKVYFPGRLTKNKEIIDSKELKISILDKEKFSKLIITKEEKIENRKINDYFSEEFFCSNFWYEFCTLFAFKKDDSLIEMKRYLLRFLNSFKYIDTLEVLQITPLNQYEFLILPIEKYLKENGVNIQEEVKIIDIEFEKTYNKKAIKKIYLTKNDKDKVINLGNNDYVFITIGSMTASSSIGDMNNPPKKKTEKLSLSWSLWENIVKNNPEYGKPEVFTNNIKNTGWTSFTITFKDSVIRDLLKQYIKGDHTAFTGTTFIDSNWFITLLFHLEKYFKNQEDDTLIAWGYTLNPQNNGNYINKKIEDCNGKEILEEIIHHFGLENYRNKILETTICIPDYTPYVTSQFIATKKGDTPPVVPENSLNFAFIGQFVDMKDDIVFTVEYSVRTAQKAVYELLGIEKKVTEIPEFKNNPKVLYNAFKTLIR